MRSDLIALNEGTYKKAQLTQKNIPPLPDFDWVTSASLERGPRRASISRAMANLAGPRADKPRLERVQWLTSQDFARTIASTRHREARPVRQGMRDRVAGTRRGDA